MGRWWNRKRRGGRGVGSGATNLVGTGRPQTGSSHMAGEGSPQPVPEDEVIIKVPKLEPGSSARDDGGAAEVAAGENPERSIVKVEDEEEQLQEEGSSPVALTPPRALNCSDLASVTTPLGAVHPLLNEDVLTRVLNHVMASHPPGDSNDVVKDVGNFRLVSRLWQKTATRLYRRRNRRGKVPPPDFLGRWRNSAMRLPLRLMPPFLEVMRGSELVPFQSYQLSSDVIAQGNEKLVEDFLEICGTEMVSLFLVLLDSHSTEKFNLNGQLPPSLDLKKLKTIEICLLDTWIWMRTLEGRKHGLANFIELILTGAKELREFKFHSRLPNANVVSQRDGLILRQFEEAISGSLPETVKSLALHIPIRESAMTMATLAQRGLKLEEFAITCYNPLGNDNESLLKFLESQAPTLKILQILDARDENLILELPRMDKLAELRLKDVQFPETFSFAGTFPNLHSLELEEWTGENTFMQLLESATTTTAPTLKKLHLPFSLPVAPHVQKLFECFPNVVELHLSYSDDLEETLAEVFTYGWNIEHLHVHYRHELDADSVFSGVSREDCERIRELPSFHGINLKGFQVKPSILNLTKLKTLVVMEPGSSRQLGAPNWVQGPLILTDFAVHFLFLEMTSLKEVHVDVRHRMSRGSLRHLRDKLSVTIRNGQGVVCKATTDSELGGHDGPGKTKSG